MIKKEDWNILDMPKEQAVFQLNRSFTDQDKKYLKEGHKPYAMEDKWFVYFEDNKVYMHRSWTGYCIFILNLDNNTVIVNRNKNQYRNTNIEEDKKILSELLDFLTRKK